MIFLKKNYKYFFAFLCFFLLVWFILYIDHSYDATWEFGMSHAFRHGFLPYKDFNLVTTPFFIFSFSIGLFVFDSFFTFLVEFCIFYTVMYYFLDKLLGKNTIYIFLGMAFTLFRAFIPTYNAICFVILVIIMYLEKKKGSNKLIGFLFGLLILTKHTIGFPIFVFLCFVFKDKKIIKERSIGLLFPIFVFFLYLLLTNTYKEFFNLCFLGLFSFGSKNTLSFSFIYIIAIFFIGLCLFFIVRRKKEENLLFYYALSSIFFIIPICDLSHITFFVSMFLIAFLDAYESRIHFSYLPYVLLIITFSINLIFRADAYKELQLSPFPNYQFTFITKEMSTMGEKIRSKVKNYKQFYFVDEVGMYFDLITDHELSYFSLPHYGNYGYDGSNRMISEVESLHDCYFIINHNRYERILNKKEICQLDIEVVGYIMNHSELVDSLDNFYIYYRK